MSTLQDIETAILDLSSQERSKLTTWLQELDMNEWDKKLEMSPSEGIRRRAENAKAAFVQGNVSPL